MRVLHVVQPTVAGVPMVVRHLAADQMAAGWDVAVAAPFDGDLAGWLRDLSVPHMKWPAVRHPGQTVPGEVRRLRRIIFDSRPELVHLHSAKAGLAGRLALRGALPTVLQPHAWSFEATVGAVGAAARGWERFASRWTDLVVCVSEDERRRGEDAGIRVPTVVIPNGVDLHRFSPASAADRTSTRRALGLAERPTVICVGRLARQKGQDILLASLPSLAARVPGVQLVLVGDGPDAEYLRSAAPSGVIFTGNRADARAWLVAADVVALPSRWEGGSLVALEAMALARPVVATAVGDAAVLLAGAGAVVPVDDPAALAEALAVRLEDAWLSEREGRAGRLRVESHYDLAVACRRVRDAYFLSLASR